jgi:hypothetical protein
LVAPTLMKSRMGLVRSSGGLDLPSRGYSNQSAASAFN